MASRFTFTKGTAQYRNYRIGIWALVVAVFLLIGFAFVDVGSISIGSNKYNLSLIRLNKAIAYGVAILGLQVVIGYTGQIALGQSFFWDGCLHFSMVGRRSFLAISPYASCGRSKLFPCRNVVWLAGTSYQRLIFSFANFWARSLFSRHLLSLTVSTTTRAEPMANSQAISLKRRLGYRLMKSLRHFKLSRFSVLFWRWPTIKSRRITSMEIYSVRYCRWDLLLVDLEPY